MTQLEGNMKKLGDVEMEIRSLTRSTYQHSKMKVKFGIPDPICVLTVTGRFTLIDLLYSMCTKSLLRHNGFQDNSPKILLLESQ